MADKNRNWVEGERIEMRGGPFDGADAEVIFKDTDQGKRVPICERYCLINDGPNASNYVYALDFETHCWKFCRIDKPTKVNKT